MPESQNNDVRGAPSTLKVIAAFAAVYFIWGSTYLFNKFALEDFPPFVLAAVRFTTAGALLYGWSRFRRAERTTTTHWRNALITGGLFFLCGNGAVLWAQQRLPSGLVALIVAIGPLWIVLLEWLRPPHKAPKRIVSAGVISGLVGLGLLMGPDTLRGNGDIDVPATLVLAAGSLLWSIGALYAQRATLPKTPSLVSAIQLLAGGALLIAVAFALGEFGETQWSLISAHAALSLAFLIFFGSIVAFSSFSWLTRVAPASRVATYAYVNPVVAMSLGWLFANERFSGRTLIASAVILAGVALITKGTAPD